MLRISCFPGLTATSKQVAVEGGGEGVPWAAQGARALFGLIPSGPAGQPLVSQAGDGAGGSGPGGICRDDEPKGPLRPSWR